MGFELPGRGLPLVFPELTLARPVGQEPCEFCEGPPPLCRNEGPLAEPAGRKVLLALIADSAHARYGGTFCGGVNPPRIPRPPPPLRSQISLISVWRILLRETEARAFFFALKAIADEKQRCEKVLGLLLPPTLVTSMRAVIVKAAALNIGDSFDSADTGSSEHEVERVASVGDERFAEAFDSASIMFAEGERRA